MKFNVLGFCTPTRGRSLTLSDREDTGFRYKGVYVYTKVKIAPLNQATLYCILLILKKSLDDSEYLYQDPTSLKVQKKKIQPTYQIMSDNSTSAVQSEHKPAVG